MDTRDDDKTRILSPTEISKLTAEPREKSRLEPPTPPVVGAGSAGSAQAPVSEIDAMSTPAGGNTPPLVVAPPIQPEMSAQHPAIGDVLKGRFRIVDSLGSGGMGMVFKAIDIRKLESKSRNPYIAIKVLNPALARNELLVAGLQRESEKAQELSHPNIITVYDFDRDGDHVFMSMEYLSGCSLSQLIRESAPSGGITIKRAWPIIQKMGEALAYAHKKNIVHSDFKPANVFVTEAGEVKVLDFGIAARTGQAGDPDATVFNARAEGGLTPPYASFEMMNGASADPRDDIYAFGLVVYELLTGKHPYNRKPASAVFIEQQRSGDKLTPPPVKGLSRKQWQLLKSAIEILQDKRPPYLEEWLRQFDPHAKWSPQLVGGMVAAVFLIVGVGGNWWLTHRSEHTSTASDTNKQSIETSVLPPAPVKLPVANPGEALQGKVGVAVQLNGSRSESGDGGAIGYAWRLVELPEGSKAMLQDASSATPQFVPDKPGHYSAELFVSDAHSSSLPVSLSINVEDVAKVALSPHKAISADGVLSLAASKPQYKIGEELKLHIRLTKAGYLKVAYLGAAGEISELFPNQYQSIRVKPDTEYFIPPKTGKYKLQVTGPKGVDRIVAVFSETPMPKVENIVDTNGELVEALQTPAVVSAGIQYDVVK
ncbi:protein kinase [Methylomonas montana]|uniref:serine/threonine-protein kinase n=1 Tax=Methylomonas montana TaxID=3058963 RepID=UPI00265B530A|nr:protein kinase [Methylomonas montana]WKJ90869.1 protein kinase [Methylomonas montana]